MCSCVNVCICAVPLSWGVRRPAQLFYFLFCKAWNLLEVEIFGGSGPTASINFGLPNVDSCFLKVQPYRVRVNNQSEKVESLVLLFECCTVP